jgi:hypothetical protein
MLPPFKRFTSTPVPNDSELLHESHFGVFQFSAKVCWEAVTRLTPADRTDLVCSLFAFHDVLQAH